MADDHANALLDMTVGIVANYVSNNQIRPDEISALIATTHAALSGAGAPAAEPVIDVDKPSAQQIRKSISEAGIVSFLDGRTYQSLRRHLRTHGYTPETYRETFGLRSDYPMVSPSYAAKRSALAKAIGLGQGGRKPKASVKAASKLASSRKTKS